jgi:hypothetical protein
MSRIIWRKQRKAMQIFVERISREAGETKEAALIITKYTKGEELSDEEEKALKEQFYDVLKIVGIGVPFAIIPGASILIPIVVTYAKRKGVNILPSSFSSEKCYCGNPVDESNPDCVTFKLCKEHANDS